MTIVDYHNLSLIRKKYSGKKIIFCSGAFDLTHAGHILFLEDCKKFGDVLVVGVGDDAIIKEYKGEKRPILNENIRLKMIDSLKPVDYCFLDHPAKIRENGLIMPLSFILENLKPDFYVVNEDSPHIPARQEIAKRNNVRLVILKRVCPKDFEQASTSKIICKIKEL